MLRKLLLMSLLVLLTSGAFAAEERQGFSMSFNVEAGTYSVLTVPAGEVFVLCQVNSSKDFFRLNVDSALTIDGYVLSRHHDFPDMCVVFGEGQVLELQTTGSLRVHVVGYFYTVAESVLLQADINNDGIVNFADLAILTSEWLETDAL